MGINCKVYMTHIRINAVYSLWEYVNSLLLRVITNFLYALLYIKLSVDSANRLRTISHTDHFCRALIHF